MFYNQVLLIKDAWTMQHGPYILQHGPYIFDILWARKITVFPEIHMSLTV